MRNLVISVISLFTFLLLPLYVYFTSPLIERLNPESLIRLEESFSEVVVIVTIDGLLWNSINATTTPFLFSQITHGAQYGYTFVKAPTESRPCHIALLAGFYEDPSSLWRLWKENGKPDFDSVFSYSNSLGIGGPDVIPFFSKGASETYRIVNFPLEWYKSKPDVRELDTFVLNELKSSYKEEALVFCHLAAVDTAGHRFGSHSPQYRQAVLHADSVIQSIVNQFKDKKASFIVTSDHGFVPNSHGHDLDHPYTKKTPLLLFGHLLDDRKRIGEERPEFPSVYWEHVNVASLITALLQTQLPSNYVGDLRTLDVLQLKDDKIRAMLAIQQAKIINARLEELTLHHFGFIAYKYRKTAAFYKASLDQLVEALIRQPESAQTVYRMVKDAVLDIQTKSKRFQKRLQLPLIFLLLISVLHISVFPIPMNAQVAVASMLLLLFIILSATPVLYLFGIVSLLLFLKPAEKKFQLGIEALHTLFMEAGSIGILFTPYTLICHMISVLLIQRKAEAKSVQYFLSILTTFLSLIPLHVSNWLIIPLVILFLWHKKVDKAQIAPVATFMLLKLFIQTKFEFWLDIIFGGAVLFARLWRRDAKQFPIYLSFIIINDSRTQSAVMLTLLIDGSYWESVWLAAFFPKGIEGYLNVSFLRRQVIQVLLTALCLPFDYPNNLLVSFFPLLTSLLISTEDQQWKTMGIVLIRHIITSVYSVSIYLLQSFVILKASEPSSKYILV